MNINETIRKQIVKNFSKKISLEDSILLESAIYDFAKQYATDNDTPFLFESIYETKNNDILSLLSCSKCVLKDIIENKKIDFNKIVLMKPEELNPDIFDIIKKQEEDKLAQNKQGTTLFKCSKCKKKNCQVKEQQMRASDEPPTLIITCLECGHVFKLD